MYRKGTKLIASMLVFTMVLTYLSTIGKVFASSLETQSTKTNNANVEFDSYFVVNTNKTHSAMQNIGEENYLYAKVVVKEAGYLKNASISLENANFKIVDTMKANAVSKVEENKITLNQIKNGNTVELAIPIQMIESTNISIEEFRKNSTIKLTGTYVDGNGKERNIEGKSNIALGWTAEKEAELEVQIAKFIPYNNNREKGLLLQTIVQSYLKDNTLPVKENEIEISVPTINNIKPQQIKVIANTTKATNGDETGISYATQENNYSYEEETNKLTINVKNIENEAGEISWQKEAKDEFIVTYIYPEEAIVEEVEVSMNAASKLTMVEGSQATARKQQNRIIKVETEKINQVVDFTIDATESISKGQIYAGYQETTNVETQYQETITVNIGLHSLISEIIIEQNADYFVTKENTKIPASQAYYKTISVDRKEVEQILGIGGEIYFYVGDQLVDKIRAGAKANEQGKYIVEFFAENENNVKIKTSHPLTEGKINFVVTKAIKGKMDYSVAQIADFNNLELHLTGTTTIMEEPLATQIATKEIALVEPTSQAELTISNSNLSTVVTNEDVKITAILKTDALDCMLYQNPTLQITLPSYIENINIKNTPEVLFDTEGTKLNLKDYKVITNQDNTKTIVISLEGTQTEYTLGAMSKGVNVVITADITVDKFTPNKQDQIKMTYTNNNAAETQKTKECYLPFNIIAPTGVITTSTISNYAENAQTLTSISGEEKTATIETMAKARNAKFEMTVINNYNNVIDNICILGRTPFKGNKAIVTGKDLGSTMNMSLASNITVNGIEANKVTIYYSENGEATKDLNLASNGWTVSPTNLANVKSYLIVLADSMNTGDKITFSYSIAIPANLQHNESAYENYVAYFTNHLATGKVQDKVESTKIEITTGKGPVLEANMTSNIPESQKVLTGKLIKYTVTVKNTGKQVAENVVANIDLPNCVTYIEFAEGETGYYTEFSSKKQITYELENIEANQTKTKSFWVIVNNLQVEDICKEESHYHEFEGMKLHKTEFTHADEEYQTEVAMKTTITAKDLAKPIESTEAKNIIAKAYFKIKQASSETEETILAEGDELQYNYSVSLYDTERTAENTIVTMVIPNGLTYKNAKIRTYNLEEQKPEEITEGITYNEKTRTLTIQLGKTTSAEKGTIEINTIVDKLQEGTVEKQFEAQITVSADNIKEETSTKLVHTVAKEKVKLTQTSTITEGATITAGEDFSYIYEIENIGGKDTGRLTFKMVVPEQVEYVSTTLQTENSKTEYYNIKEGNLIEVQFAVEKGKTVKIIIHVTAKELEQDVTIKSKASVSSANIGETVSNEIAHTVKAVNEQEPEQPGTITRRIVGQIWKDENNNGIKEAEEPKMANVEVLLFNNETGKLVTDSEQNIIRQITKEDGNYAFTNIMPGKYTIIFLYDTANYSATTYRKENVDETKNSDGVDTQITLDGITRMAAITEQIVITDKNSYNMDLGLITNAKFDLKLDKSVSKITVQDPTGTQVYNYENTKLAKKELVAKLVNDTTILVEYKITITNEGAVPGYAKKIVDYIPAEMKFNSELNRDWYIAENGAIYNSSLANTIIHPGESKEVSLLLTKKMTQDNLSLYHNEAEIYEAYNDLGIPDVDSTPGNKASNEDDISSADVLISVKTGETILFVGLTITIITIIGTGAYFIKKKVLR